MSKEIPFNHSNSHLFICGDCEDGKDSVLCKIRSSIPKCGKYTILDKKVEEIVTAFVIHDDEKVWDQVKHIILYSGRFDAREWVLQVETPIVKNGEVSLPFSRLIKKKS